MHVRLKKYRTPEQCMAAFWRPAGMTLTELRKSTGFGLDIETGKKVKHSFLDQIELIRGMGVWGFLKNRTIHYWHDGKRSKQELSFFLGHELGHLVLDRKNRFPKKSVKEELQCEEFGEVASMVFELLPKMK